MNMVFGKIKNAIHHKIDDVKEDRAKTKEIKQRVKKDEKEIYYRQLEKEMRAKSFEKASHKAEHNAQPRIERAANTSRRVVKAMPKLNRNGPDPFGLFNNQPHQNFDQYPQRHKNRHNRKRQVPQNGFNRDDYLNNLM